MLLTPRTPIDHENNLTATMATLFHGFDRQTRRCRTSLSSTAKVKVERHAPAVAERYSSAGATATAAAGSVSASSQQK